MSTVCQTALQRALNLRQEFIRESLKVKEQGLQEFFSAHKHIEELTVTSRVIEGQYNSHLEIEFANCRVKRCGCLIPIPVLALQDDAQLYSDIGNILLTLALLKGVLVDGSVTFCRLNYVP